MKILVLLMAGAAVTSVAMAEIINFDDAALGKPPPGWTATMTGKGEAKWTVEKDATAPTPPNILKQSGQAAYPLCIKENTNLKDGFVEVKFKAISGKIDQAAGLIWRCQDANNYYIARANALENNVTIYRTVKGRRISFKNTDIKVTAGQWHTLRVEFQGSRFKVIFNGQPVMEAEDNTFGEAGKVGLWTKADSVTEFDDFSFGSQ